MFRRITSCLTVISLMTVSLTPLTALASDPQQLRQQARQGHGKVAADLADKKHPGETVRVIIQTKGSPTLDQENAIADRGGLKRKALADLNVLVADVPA